MAFKRPSSQQIRARQLDIRRRYERQAKVGKRTKSMAAIRISELMRWLGHVAGAGAELDATEHSATIARIFVHHFVVLADGNRKASDWLETYCPWIECRDREHMITEANHCPLKWSADKLAWKIRLTDAKRTELRITTIGAIDVTKEQRAARRKQRRAELMRTRRAERRQARVNTI